MTLALNLLHSSSLESKISKEENIYKEWLSRMEKYEESLNEKNSEVKDVLKHKGFIEVKDSLVNELADLEVLINQSDIDLNSR